MLRNISGELSWELLIDQNAQILEHKCVPFADKLLYSDLMHLQPQQKNPVDPKTFR